MEENKRKINDKNKEQSEKSQKGHDFNYEMECSYILWSNEISSFGFYTSETPYVAEQCGEHISSARCQIDQLCYLANNIKKQLKLVFIDNTTSARDRTKGKSSNSADVYFFKEMIIQDFISKHPKFEGYDIFFEVGILYPDELIGVYKNPNGEKQKIILDCANINYQTGIRHRLGEIYGLDFAVQKSQLYACLKYFDKHPELDFSKIMIRDIWKQIYSSYKYMPPIWLSKKAIDEQWERVVFCLETYSSKYSLEIVKKVLKDFGIDMKKSSTKKECISKIFEIIENQNP